MTSPEASLQLMLRTLKLPSFAANHEEIGQQAGRHGWTFSQGLRQLCELELHERRERRIGRLMKASKLPGDKTRATLDETKLPAKVRRQMPALCEGGFAERGENVLLFGLPGRGKSHVASAIGHELVQRGHSVLFSATRTIVEKLLVAKRELELDRMLRRLDGFDVVVLDDIGYVQQDRDEMEVLFTLFAQRYERRSVVITSNLVFSQWDRIFKDPMTTAAAIDRLVHHATILEMTGPSHRSQEARTRSAKTTRKEGDDN